MVTGELREDTVILEDSDAARDFYASSAYGNIVRKRVHLSLYEALYLVEKEKIVVKRHTNESLLKKAAKNKAFLTKYIVFSDLRARGYIVKTALKFGADFRVYDRGVKPGKDHARWVVFAVKETDKHTWHDFSAKNRVAHSTRKKLLLAVVDEELDVSYWESAWIRP